MKFFFAGAEADNFRELLDKVGAKNSLVSYFSYKKVEKIKDGEVVFLDSGAFTAFTQGKVINIDKYIEYLKTYKDKYFVYANLDVIGDPEKTLENQRYIEMSGVLPLPTIHFGADEKYLHLYAKSYDYIALGGLVPHAKDKVKLQWWLDKCFAILIPYILDKKLKVHGFGVGAAEILKKYPFYSADSTGWLIGGKFGTIVTWDDQKFKVLSGAHYQDKDTYLKRGGNLTQLTETYEGRLEHNIKEYLKMEKDITRLWETRGIVWKD